MVSAALTKAGAQGKKRFRTWRVPPCFEWVAAALIAPIADAIASFAACVARA
jgi:hypothetical protein